MHQKLDNLKEVYPQSEDCFNLYLFQNMVYKK